MITNPKYNNENELQNVETKLKHYKKDDDDDDEQKLRKQQLKEKPKQHEVICKFKVDYYNNIIRKSKTNLDFLDLSYKTTYTDSDVQYIQDYNFYRHEIKRLNEIIKPKIRNINQINEIIIIEEKNQ
jgi:hypothetical protein